MKRTGFLLPALFVALLSITTSCKKYVCGFGHDEPMYCGTECAIHDDTGAAKADKLNTTNAAVTADRKQQAVTEDTSE